MVEETGAGEVVDAGDVVAIGQHLRAFIADPALRKRYSAASLKAAPSYTWEEEAQQLVALYSSLLSPGRGDKDG